MATLNLIRYDHGKYGLEELDDDGLLSALYDARGQQLLYIHALKRTYTYLRTIAEGDQYDLNKPDDFRRAIDGVSEILIFHSA